MSWKNKEKSLSDEKFKVLTTMAVFAFKIMKEIVDKDMGNSIVGRSSIRSLIEVFLMLKSPIKLLRLKV